jgi:hypothetical protein
VPLTVEELVGMLRGEVMERDYVVKEADAIVLRS